jgi:hypothetical protein
MSGVEDLLALADRVEALAGPDREVDELVLLAVGWRLARAKGLGERATWFDPDGQRTAHRQGDGWFRPTASLDDAMTVAGGLGGQVTFFKDGTAKAYLWQPYPLAIEVKAATPALALCAAALRARSLVSLPSAQTQEPS